MLNNCVIMGRLTADPELRYTKNKKPVLSISVACDRDMKNQDGEKACDFIRVTFYGSAAEHIGSYYRKGSMIVVVGRIQQSKWTDRDGNTRETLEILGHHCYFGDSKKAAEAKHGIDSRFKDIDADDDFPF